MPLRAFTARTWDGGEGTVVKRTTCSIEIGVLDDFRVGESLLRKYSSRVTVVMLEV